MNGAKSALTTPMKMKRFRSLSVSNAPSSNALFDQIFSSLVANDLLADLSTTVKEVSHETESEVPLEHFGETVAAKRDILSSLGLVTREATVGWAREQPGRNEMDDLARDRETDTEIEKVLVEQSDEVVLLSEDTVGNVVSVKLCMGRLGSVLPYHVGQRRGLTIGKGSDWVLVFDLPHEADYLGPRHGLNVRLASATDTFRELTSGTPRRYV